MPKVVIIMLIAWLHINNCFSQDWMSFIDEREPLFYVEHIALKSILSPSLKGKVTEENIVFYQWNFDTEGMKATYIIRKIYNTKGDITACYYNDYFINVSEVMQYNYGQDSLLREFISTGKTDDEGKSQNEKASVYKRYYTNVLNSDGKIGLIQSRDSSRYNTFMENTLHYYNQDFELSYKFNAMSPDTGSRLAYITVSGSGKWKFGTIRIWVDEYYPRLNGKKFASNGLINNSSVLMEKYKPRLINENAFEITINGVKQLYLRNYKKLSYTRDTIKLNGENIVSKYTRILMYDKRNYKLQEIELTFFDNGKVDDSREIYKWQKGWMRRKKILKIYYVEPNYKEYYAKYAFRFKKRGSKTEAHVTFWSYHDLYSGR